MDWLKKEWAGILIVLIVAYSVLIKPNKIDVDAIAEGVALKLKFEKTVVDYEKIRKIAEMEIGKVLVEKDAYKKNIEKINKELKTQKEINEALEAQCTGDVSGLKNQFSLCISKNDEFEKLIKAQEQEIRIQADLIIDANKTITALKTDGGAIEEMLRKCQEEGISDHKFSLGFTFTYSLVNFNGDWVSGFGVGFGITYKVVDLF